MTDASCEISIKELVFNKNIKLKQVRTCKVCITIEREAVWIHVGGIAT